MVEWSSVLQPLVMVACLVAACFGREADTVELERAEFRAQSWPSAPGRDAFSTGVAEKFK